MDKSRVEGGMSVCYNVSMRDIQKRFPSFTHSIFSEHLLLQFAGSYSRFLECISEQHRQGEARMFLSPVHFLF